MKIMVALELEISEETAQGMTPTDFAQLTYDQIEEGDLTLLDLMDLDENAQLIVNGYE